MHNGWEENNIDARVNYNAEEPSMCDDVWQKLSFAGAFAHSTSYTQQCDAFWFNHIRQMAPIVDADAKSCCVGESARRAGSRWALPRKL